MEKLNFVLIFAFSVYRSGSSSSFSYEETAQMQCFLFISSQEPPPSRDRLGFLVIAATNNVSQQSDTDINTANCATSLCLDSNTLFQTI